MARAAEGNTAALGRLGIGLSRAELATLSMDEITAKLADTFENQASAKADTFQGKLARLQIAFDEGKETVGAYILDAITPMVTLIVEQVIPAIENFTSNIGDKLQPVLQFIQPIINGLRNAFNSVRNSLEDNNEELQPFINLMKAVATFARDTLAPVIGKTLGAAFTVLGNIISGLIDTFAGFVRTLTNIFDTIMSIIDAIKRAASVVGGFFSGAFFGSPTGPVRPSPPIPQSPTGAGLFGSPSSTNITVNGAIDPISTARQIASILNIEATNSGSFNGLGISRAYLV
jgi:phage-related protein